MIDWMMAHKDTGLAIGNTVWALIRVAVLIMFVIAVANGNMLSTMTLGIFIICDKLDNIMNAVKKDE